MKTELFISLIKEAKNLSSMYTLADILNDKCETLDIRGVAHKGFFASITDFPRAFLRLEHLTYNYNIIII